MSGSWLLKSVTGDNQPVHDCDEPRSAFLTTATDSPWRPWVHRLERVMPLVLLGLATFLSLLQDQPWERRWGTLALVGVALCWVLATDTFLPRRWRESTPVLVVAFAGLLTIASVLMARDLLFLIFLITCFFRAIVLGPMPLVLLGLTATSALINSLGSGGPLQALREWPVPYLAIVLIQTLAIGGGLEVSRQLVRQNEQRRKAVAALEAALEENAGLHRQLLAQAREAGVLDERQRLSQEIHDTLAQGFTGIITQLQAAEEAHGDPAERQRHLDAASALARENLQEARRAVHALGPEALDGGAGLPEALAGVVRRWSQRFGVPAEFTTTGTPGPMHPEIEATLLRITQEALGNVAEHAKAGRVGLTLSYMEDQLTLDVRDDGVGFDQDRLRRNGNGYRGFGLSGMRQRVQRLAGSLVVESEPGGGTAISATVPAIPFQESR
ncbi:sensor histidine kinase [Prauserella endophytica]|uniref:Oxygen sensor histidine kinase NreB n=1 Tax=Prauserella endophytica TaxID=1592324 RepID=A0ABY2RYE5_9PSEU|nr:sensor histidine kinase [Prauserella endophytica]TKG65213.1 sensor histidine kinase [Prauserella endophytica]